MTDTTMRHQSLIWIAQQDIAKVREACAAAFATWQRTKSFDDQTRWMQLKNQQEELEKAFNQVRSTKKFMKGTI